MFVTVRKCPVFFAKIGHTDTGIGKMQFYIVDCFHLTFDTTFYIKREFGFILVFVWTDWKVVCAAVD